MCNRLFKSARAQRWIGHTPSRSFQSASLEFASLLLSLSCQLYMSIQLLYFQRNATATLATQSVLETVSVNAKQSMKNSERRLTYPQQNDTKINISWLLSCKKPGPSSSDGASFSWFCQGKAANLLTTKWWKLPSAHRQLKTTTGTKPINEYNCSGVEAAWRLNRRDKRQMN